MDEFYEKALKNKWLNDGISYLFVTAENKDGKTERMKFEIDEQETEIYSETVSILSKLVKEGYKIAYFKITRYYEY